jgi:hypothetical protein
MSSESWITVRHINGDVKCFDYVKSLSAKDLTCLLDDQNPNVSIEIINDSDVLKDDFVFDKNTQYILTLVKTRSLYSYHQELYDILYDKLIEVTKREIYYCYSVEYYGGTLTLRIRSIKSDDRNRNIVYHREFYYRQGRTYLDFDRYNGEYGIIINKLEEFSNSFDIETRKFMDEIIRKCKSEEDKRDCYLLISFNMPDNRDEIIHSMDINICNGIYDYDSNLGDSDEDLFDYHPY